MSSDDNPLLRMPDARAAFGDERPPKWAVKTADAICTLPAQVRDSLGLVEKFPRMLRSPGFQNVAEFLSETGVTDSAMLEMILSWDPDTDSFPEARL